MGNKTEFNFRTVPRLFGVKDAKETREEEFVVVLIVGRDDRENFVAVCCLSSLFLANKHNCGGALAGGATTPQLLDVQPSRTFISSTSSEMRNMLAYSHVLNTSRHYGALPDDSTMPTRCKHPESGVFQGVTVPLGLYNCS